MKFTILKKDSHNATAVESWQSFLYGYFFAAEVNVDDLIVDGIFGKKTESYTIRFQRENSLVGDGIVGPATLAKAIELGYGMFEDTESEFAGPSWPPRPQKLWSLNSKQKHKHFGEIKFKMSTHGGSREAITITNDWQKKFLTKVEVPQLKNNHDIIGSPRSGNVFCNKLVADSLLKLWQEWENKGLLDNVKSYAGMWVPRLVRGSTTTLSSHAWGTAFDINAAWNMIGRTPALTYEYGSVRRLVETAADLGWFWGGWWGTWNDWSRPDGMHFEFANTNLLKK
jgi:hypothetical protein